MRNIDPRQMRSIIKLQDAYFSLLVTSDENISIQQLCKEAQVTRPTFYNNYSDILDLRKQIHEGILGHLEKSLTITNKKPLDAFDENELPENMVNLFKHVLENKKAYEVLLLHRPDGLFIENVKGILRRFIVDGIKYASSEEQNLQIEIPFIISYATGAYYESVIWWMQNNYSLAPEEMAKLLLKISIYGPFERES